MKDWKDSASEEKHAIAGQQVTIAAEQGVIVKQAKSQAITNKTEGDYAKESLNIDKQYADGLQQPDSATSNGLSKVSITPSVTRPVACARTSKVKRAIRVAVTRWPSQSRRP